MTRRIARLREGDGGVTLVELMVAMMITAILGAVVATWMTSAARAVTMHREDDRAVQDLRQAKDLLTREVRTAAVVTAISSTSLTFWVDANYNGEADDGETITWSIEPGALVRSTDAPGEAEPLVVLEHLVIAGSGFAYDAEVASEVRLVEVALVVSAGSPDRTRSLSTLIHLRNSG